MSKARIDLTPLRVSPNYRLVFSAGLISSFGSMITYVAIPFQVAQLTGSFVAVGIIGALELIPLVVFGLYGGALADHVDRRKMALAMELTAGMLVLVLMANSMLAEPRLWVIYIVAVLLTSADALQRPSIDAILPRVVGFDQLAAAGALNTIRWSLSSIAGPALGGLLLAFTGPSASFAIDAMTYFVSALLLWRLPSIKSVTDRVGIPRLRDVTDGMRYAIGRRDLLGTYLVDIIAMLFAFPYALFPFVAEQFDAPWSLGFLYSAGAVGGLLVSLTSGWISHVHRHGRAVVIAAMVWGLGVAAVGFAPNIIWVLVFLAVAGAGDMVSGIFRGLMWNQTIPDDLRGRMAGIELLSYSIGPQLGQVRSSLIASLTSLRFSIASGGILCVIGVAAAAAFLPAMWSFDARTDINARRRREQQG